MENNCCKNCHGWVGANGECIYCGEKKQERYQKNYIPIKKLDEDVLERISSMALNNEVKDLKENLDALYAESNKEDFIEDMNVQITTLITARMNEVFDGIYDEFEISPENNDYRYHLYNAVDKSIEYAFNIIDNSSNHLDKKMGGYINILTSNVLYAGYNKIRSDWAAYEGENQFECSYQFVKTAVEAIKKVADKEDLASEALLNLGVDIIDWFLDLHFSDTDYSGGYAQSVTKSANETVKKELHTAKYHFQRLVSKMQVFKQGRLIKEKNESESKLEKLKEIKTQLYWEQNKDLHDSLLNEFKTIEKRLKEIIYTDDLSFLRKQRQRLNEELKRSRQVEATLGFGSKDAKNRVYTQRASLRRSLNAVELEIKRRESSRDSNIESLKSRLRNIMNELTKER